MATNSVDTGFLYNRNDVLYPVSLSTRSSSDSQSVSTLVQLCSQKLVMDASSTALALEVAPTDLCHSLMEAALLLTRDLAIEVLVSHWPYPTLCLRRYASPLFEELGVLYDDDCVGDNMRRAVKYTTSLAHNFVEGLKKRSPTKLRCLDLTGFPTAEVIVNYLSSHVLLGYNESRQRELGSLYNSLVHNLPTHHPVDLVSTLPEEKCVIHLDARLTSTNCYMELGKALRSSTLDHCLFKLNIQNLDVSCLGVPRVCVLLELIDNKMLQGLCLKHNGITPNAMRVLSAQLCNMTALSSLDLSCNLMRLTGSESGSTMTSLVQALSALPSLTRLNISGIRIKGQLSQLLSVIQSSLQFLRVCGCGLNLEDISYLARSHHVTTLKELDLSENSLIAATERRGVAPEMVELCERLAPSLVVLELEDVCSVEGSDYADMLEACSRLHNVRYLNLASVHNFNVDRLILAVKHLVAMKHLEVVRISYPPAVYTSDNDQIIDSIKSVFAQLIHRVIESASFCYSRRKIKVVFS